MGIEELTAFSKTTPWAPHLDLLSAASATLTGGHKPRSLKGHSQSPDSARLFRVLQRSACCADAERAAGKRAGRQGLGHLPWRSRLKATGARKQALRHEQDCDSALTQRLVWVLGVTR